MKKNRLLVLTALLAGSVVTLETARDLAAGAQNAGNDFREQITGVYLLDVSFPSFPHLFSLLRISMDGTYQTTLTQDFGLGDLGQNGFASREHGVWEALGMDKIATTSLRFILDPNGAQVNFSRVRTTTSFSNLVDGRFQVITGDFTIDYFNPDQNPITDAPVVLDGLQGEFTGKRLNLQ
jgi:hypothetical protein